MQWNQSLKERKLKRKLKLKQKEEKKRQEHHRSRRGGPSLAKADSDSADLDSILADLPEPVDDDVLNEEIADDKQSSQPGESTAPSKKRKRLSNQNPLHGPKAKRQK